MKIDDSKLEVYLLATFLKKWNLYQGFISILRYWKFGKCFQKISEVVEFTLKQKKIQSFPKNLSKKWKIYFWKYTLKICMIRKEK
jgi:hypothetical protein